MGAQLDYLCGIHVMGWKLSNGVDMYSDGQWYIGSEETPETQRQLYEWNPSACLDDALLCLERVAVRRRWEIKSYEKFDNDTQTYFYVRLVNHTSGPKIKRTKANHEKLSVAICLCALRACGVKEDEISKALAAAS